jgi:hypothetical protein
MKTTAFAFVTIVLLLSSCFNVPDTEKKEPPLHKEIAIDTSLLYGDWRPVIEKINPQDNIDTVKNVFQFTKNGDYNFYIFISNKWKKILSGKYVFTKNATEIKKYFISPAGNDIDTDDAIIKLTKDTLILKGVGIGALPGQSTYVHFSDPNFSIK